MEVALKLNGTQAIQFGIETMIATSPFATQQSNDLLKYSLGMCVSTFGWAAQSSSPSSQWTEIGCFPSRLMYTLYVIYIYKSINLQLNDNSNPNTESFSSLVVVHLLVCNSFGYVEVFVCVHVYTKLFINKKILVV